MTSAATHFAGKRTLVTGGAGFIGSNLARTLAAAGARVTVVDSLLPAYGGNRRNLHDAPPGITVNIADVRDRHAMTELVRGQDVIFNLAAQTSHLDSMREPFTDLEINATAQLGMLEACRQANPDVDIVYTSTRQVYGRPRYLPVDEAHPIRPVDVNGVSKVAGEQFHVLYHDVYGLRTRVLRLTNTYGPRMRIKDARQTFLGVWIKQALRDDVFEVWGGTQIRDFNYVDDVTAALLGVAADASTAGQTYNVGTAEQITLLDLARLLVEVAGRGGFEVREFPAERLRIDVGDVISSAERLKTAIGWTPCVSLAEGLERTVRFYRQELEHYL